VQHRYPIFLREGHAQRRDLRKQITYLDRLFLLFDVVNEPHRHRYVYWSWACDHYVVLKIWSTGLIALRIWRVNKLSVRLGASSLMPVILVIIESGAIYSATLTALLALYLSQSWVQYVLLDAVREVVSITVNSKSDPYSTQISSIVVCIEM